MTADARAIDIHNHIVPTDIPPYAGKHGGGRWPQMVPCDARQDRKSTRLNSSHYSRSRMPSSA